MNPLTDNDFTLSGDPWGLARSWMKEAEGAEPRDPNAMALATADHDGLPDVRMVLLKGFDEAGFVFYTNSESAKGTQLADNSQAAVVLYWKSLNRQIRARGAVSAVSDAESDAYFASRHPRSRAGAIASAQSRPLESRAALESRVQDLEAQFGSGPIPPSRSLARLPHHAPDARILAGSSLPGCTTASSSPSMRPDGGHGNA